MTDKERIINKFYENIKGMRPDVTGINTRHDGREGHWLERQFGITANADNRPDLFGYELKDETTSKTTFGDWSANRYIFTHEDFMNLFNGRNKGERRDSFLHIFGKSNEDKGGRYSWSGSPCPKIHGYNPFGQKLEITAEKDIVAIYNYNEDLRRDKATIVPRRLQLDRVELARWYGMTSPTNRKTDKCIKDKLEDKFNCNGWFTCKKGANGVYEKICFGAPINFDRWIEMVENGTVFFDSGMYQGNKRPYSQWRASNTLWNSLIIEEYL